MDAAAYFQSGEAHFQNGRCKEAVADLTEAVRLDPGNARAYCLRGIVHERMEKVDEAVADYSQAVKLKSDYAKAYCNRANLYAGMGIVANAVADYEMAIRHGADDSTTRFNCGIMSGQMGSVDKAIEHLTCYIKMEKDAPGRNAKNIAEAYSARGMSYGLKGDCDSALRDFDAALQADRGNENAMSFQKVALELKKSGVAPGNDFSKRFNEKLNQA
jgi:Flp pilus assembly protein TadD